MQNVFLCLSLVSVNASVANTTVLAAGPGVLSIFSGGEWSDMDPAWSWPVFDVRTVVVYYFQPSVRYARGFSAR